MGRIFKILVGGFQKAKMQPVQLEFEGQIRTNRMRSEYLKKKSQPVCRVRGQVKRNVHQCLPIHSDGLQLAANVLHAFRMLGNVQSTNVVFGSRQCAIALAQRILVASDGLT
jgi:hypothetical protein